jgi:hypothetical protein
MKAFPACVFAIAFLASAAVSVADTVLLKNGQSFTGTWVKADDKTLTLQIANKEHTINLADVFRVTFGTPLAIQTLVIDDVKYEVIEAKASADTLTIQMMATNQSSDGDFVICEGREVPSCGRSVARLTDDKGRTYLATEVTIGNLREKSKLINGVRTPITVRFAKMPVSGGVMEAMRVERLEFASYRAGTKTAGRGEFKDLAIKK